MSTVVSDIRNNIVTVVQATLPEATELPYQWDISENDFRNVDEGFAVLAREAISNPTTNVTRFYTMAHRYSVVFTSRYLNKGYGDQDQRNKLDELYSRAHQVFVATVNTYVGKSDFVVNVNQPEIFEPLFIEEDETVALELSFIVQYRQQIV